MGDYIMLEILANQAGVALSFMTSRFLASLQDWAKKRRHLPFGLKAPTATVAYGSLFANGASWKNLKDRVVLFIPGRALKYTERSPRRPFGFAPGLT